MAELASSNGSSEKDTSVSTR